jgi:hypothetical protein
MENETLKRKGGANADGEEKNNVHSIFKQRCVTARISSGCVDPPFRELRLIVLPLLAPQTKGRKA